MRRKVGSHYFRPRRTPVPWSVSYTVLILMRESRTALVYVPLSLIILAIPRQVNLWDARPRHWRHKDDKKNVQRRPLLAPNIVVVHSPTTEKNQVADIQKGECCCRLAGTVRTVHLWWAWISQFHLGRIEPWRMCGKLHVFLLFELLAVCVLSWSCSSCAFNRSLNVGMMGML
jgi:hypothetical protein